MPKGQPVPSTVPQKIRHYLSTKNMNEPEFAARCGLSQTQVHRLLNGQRKNWSHYTASRINSVINNGADFRHQVRRTRTNVSQGKLIPVPTWMLDPARRAIQKHGQTVAGRKMNVDGGVLRKIVEGKQIQARQETVARMNAYFKDRGKTFQTATNGIPVQPKKQEELPIGVHRAEMNQLIDAFNSWTDEQREAFSNLAHAFRKRPEAPAVSAEEKVLMEQKISKLETECVQWENKYRKLEEATNTVRRLLA